MPGTVAGLLWNGWPESAGISGRIGLENAVKALNESFMTPLFEALGVDKIKNYHPWADDPQDLQWKAVDKAVEHHAEIAEMSLVKLPDRALFIDYLPEWEQYEDALDKSRIEFFDEKLRGEIEKNLRQLMPVLLDEVDETTPETIRLVLEAHRKMQGRRKKGRVSDGYKNLEITEEGWGSVQDMQIRADMIRILDAAETLRGKKGRRFIEARLNDISVAEATWKVFRAKPIVGYDFQREITAFLEEGKK